HVTGVVEGGLLDAKWAVEQLYAALKVEPSYGRPGEPFLQPGKAARTAEGWLGELHPAVIEGVWGAFELDLDPLVAAAPEAVEVDGAEAADRRRRVALAAAAHQQRHRRADAAGGDEADAESVRRGRGQLCAQLRADVRRLPELGPQRIDRFGQKGPLLAHLAPQLLLTRFSGRHSSTPPSSAVLPRSPARAPAVWPSGPRSCRPGRARPRRGARCPRRSVRQPRSAAWSRFRPRRR